MNVTDLQSRALNVRVSAQADDSRLIELDSAGDIELGTGSALIERYVLQRATFGRGVAVGFFLCTKPCTDPLGSFLVAYSPDQLFAANGQLDLRFRIVSASGAAAEITRVISAEMLPGLWENPTIEAR